MKTTVAFAACLALAFCLHAESLTVRVVDNDLDFPLEGVALTMSGSGIAAETDASGTAVIELPDGFSRGLLAAQLPGYLGKRVSVTSGTGKLTIALSITDVVEGKELVVERAAPGKTDEKSGVSVVMETKDMESTANIGLVEDVMSSIKTLPGVGFTGGMNAQPSIRGGYPDELGAVLDGVYIVSPWHWGGAYSIFNPNMVSTAKMSHGIFSARYGRAMSGLLEVTTVKPDSGTVIVDGGIATTSCDLFVQSPIGDKAGIFIGGKLTYLESMQFINDVVLDNDPKLEDTIPTMPYIRDFYAKLYYDPTPRLGLTFNGFFGSDGIGVEDEAEESGITSGMKFDYTNYQGFAALSVKWMPTERNIVRFLGAYNNHTMDVDYEETLSGSREYSDEFVDEYGAYLGGATGYDLGNLTSEGFSRVGMHQGQAKLETDVQLTPGHILTFGAEGVLQKDTVEEEFSGWTIIDDFDPAQFRRVTYTMDADGNRVVNSSAYALWSFGEDQSLIQGELGVRGDHYYLWNDDFDLNTVPVVNPRLSVNWTPIRQRGFLDKLTISAGTGVFSMFPVNMMAAEEKYGIDDFEFGPNRAWFQVVGVEAFFPESWSFRIEGYYKHYFNRMYVVDYYNATNDTFDLEVADDGYGYSTGFDFMLRKKEGRYFDGYLSYSFVVSQYKNPGEIRGETDETIDGDPLDEWYYPSFHRFHTLNAVLNWKPVRGLTLSVIASLATGRPMEDKGEITMHPIILDGQVVEIYRRTSVYSDTLRTEISCPVNLRLSYSNYFRNSKIRWEWYVGAEDIFVNLYKPKATSSFDPFTGEEIADSDSADYNIGIPVMSVGYKVSY